jgi:hypothetical protein
MEVSGQMCAEAVLIPRRELPVPIRWEAEWAPEPVWLLSRRENLFSLPGIEPGPFREERGSGLN